MTSIGKLKSGGGGNYREGMRCRQVLFSSAGALRGAISLPVCLTWTGEEVGW